jgi:hypothetical protein
MKRFFLAVVLGSVLLTIGGFETLARRCGRTA